MHSFDVCYFFLWCRRRADILISPDARCNAQYILFYPARRDSLMSNQTNVYFRRARVCILSIFISSSLVDVIDRSRSVLLCSIHKYRQTALVNQSSHPEEERTVASNQQIEFSQFECKPYTHHTQHTLPSTIYTCAFVLNGVCRRFDTATVRGRVKISKLCVLNLSLFRQIWKLFYIYTQHARWEESQIKVFCVFIQPNEVETARGHTQNTCQPTNCWACEWKIFILFARDFSPNLALFAASALAQNCVQLVSSFIFLCVLLFFFFCSCCHLPSVDETHTLTIFCVVNRTRKIDVGQITCRHSPGGMRVRTLLTQEMGWRHKLLCLDFRQFLFSRKFERFRLMKFLCIVKHILYMRLSFPALPTVVFISLLYSRSLYCVVF